MRDTSQKSPVIVGLSGGVDSAVAALLLKQDGYPVEALHMSNWSDDDGYCSAADDLQDAREVARLLDITLHHVDFSAAYRKQVFDEFLDDYNAGLTPNPDVLCNREIKFGVYLEHARRLGAEYIATGHYAAVQVENGVATLRIPLDEHKDQTYFLHAVQNSALTRTLFPLAELTKPEVREIAARAGLPNRDKKDSTGICFIGERPFREFLSRYVASGPGPIETLDGQVIGEHQGAIYYTAGQRKGLGIGGVRDASDAPWFVASRDVERNIVRVVQGKNHPALYHGFLTADRWHWIDAPEVGPTWQSGYQARIRHGQALAACAIRSREPGRIEVEFVEPQWAVAAGQYVVVYRERDCLGGGRIMPESAAEPAADVLQA